MLTAFAAVLLLPSCADRYKEVKVTGVKLESVRPSSLRSVDAVLLVDVDNPLRSKVKVKKMSGTVYQNSKQIATLSSDDEVELAPKAISSNRINIRVTVDNALVFLEQFQNGFRPNYKEFTVDLSAVAGSGLFQFPMEKKNIPAEELVRQARKVWKK